MIGRIVEVAEDHRHLCLHRGFLVVMETEGPRRELGHVPLDDISAVIAHAHGMSYTNNLLVALAERGIPFVLCDSHHHTVGVLWPLGSHHETSRRIEAQVACNRATRNRLWTCLVRSKLQQQALALRTVGAASAPLETLVKQVKPGDPGNVEAQGARRYWPRLLGPDFRRDPGAPGVNALLNYGYTVLRATVARSVLAAGLHPAIGLHHSNDGNALRLVDDLMEPFRPTIDIQVHALVQQGSCEITPAVKRALAHAVYADMATEVGRTPLSVCTQRLATSLALVLLKTRKTLDLPLPVRPDPNSPGSADGEPTC